MCVSYGSYLPAAGGKRTWARRCIRRDAGQSFLIDRVVWLSRYGLEGPRGARETRVSHPRRVAMDDDACRGTRAAGQDVVWSLTEGRRAPISRPAFSRRRFVLRAADVIARSRARDISCDDKLTRPAWNPPPHRVAGPLPQRALGFLGVNHPVRARAIAIVFNPWFDRFIMSLIMLNCLFLAMDSKEPGFAETTRGCVRHPPPENSPINNPPRNHADDLRR